MAEAIFLHQTFIGKGEVSFRSQNQVIQNCNVENLTGFFDLPGQIFIGFTGYQVPRRMTVT